jgi:2-polyprenyl-3-methyl-5-hydroxy-6-metoxy-1,4-benzoquinol methylase
MALFKRYTRSATRESDALKERAASTKDEIEVMGSELKVNSKVYSSDKPFTVDRAPERWAEWCVYLQANGLSAPEYLLPLARIETEVAPFSYESLPVSKIDAELQSQIDALKDWHYQMEFKDRAVSTRGFRHEHDWGVHRYRGSLLVRNTAKLMGNNYNNCTVLDVGCACGLFTMEFAHQGCARAVGVDLRESNIKQAQWLAETYGVKNTVFEVENARNIQRFTGFDIVFCAGLFYHITFPMEFMKSLFDCCDDVLVFDTLLHNHPISAFNLILGRDTSYAAEGETSYEFHPTYRVVIDCLTAVGFVNIIEIAGPRGREIGGYANMSTRSFFAFKPGSKSYPLFRERLQRT